MLIINKKKFRSTKQPFTLLYYLLSTYNLKLKNF